MASDLSPETLEAARVRLAAALRLASAGPALGAGLDPGLDSAPGPGLEPADPDAHGPVDALRCLEAARQAVLAEAPEGARTAVARGLDSPGAEDPAVRLALLRALAIAACLSDEDGERMAETLQERAALLRRLGLDRRASRELQLGAALLREPTDFEATVLRGVLDDEREHLERSGRSSADTVLPDVLTALAVHALSRGGLEHAEEAERLLDEALTALEAQHAAGRVVPVGSTSAVRLMLARLTAGAGRHESARAHAETVLGAESSDSARASAHLVLAASLPESDGDQALEHGLRAVELMTGAGLRRGAAAAAAHLARRLGEHVTVGPRDVGAGPDEARHDAGHTAADAEGPAAVLAAWELAATQAERAEAPDAPALAFAWGHQLLLTGLEEEAEAVLDSLVTRSGLAGAHRLRAHALVDRGYARHGLGRADEALDDWRLAAELFVDEGDHEDAARTLLAAGALAGSTEESVGGLELFSRAVDHARIARDEDPGLLAVALHSLGYAMCERSDPQGLEVLDEAMTLAERTGTAWQRADFLDTRARALWALSRPQEAASAALEAADRFRAAADAHGGAQAELFAAFVVAESGAPEQAATLFGLLADAEDQPYLVRVAALSGLAQCLEQIGDDDGAAAARARLEALREEPQ